MADAVKGSIDEFEQKISDMHYLITDLYRFMIMSIAFYSEELSKLFLKHDISSFEDVVGGHDFPEVCLAVTEDLS